VTLLAAALWTISAFGIGCDAPGPFTKAGTRPVSGFTIAADPRVLPIGSIVVIEGLGERMVHDVGPAVRGLHLDVFMDDCKAAKRWGVPKRRVRILHIGGTR
jgi:3D (Asp-Asp-Asp) domain-containing protein